MLTLSRRQGLFISTSGCTYLVLAGLWLLMASPVALAAEAPPQPPELEAARLRGLQAGVTNRFFLTGKFLSPHPKLVGLPPGAEYQVLPGNSATRVEFMVSLPSGIPVGHYPLRVQTPHGLSGSLPIAIEGLPQLAAGDASPEKPLVLPVALSGELSGSERAVFSIAGRAGMSLVIDVECRRLGGQLSPVLELKNARRTPLAIQWAVAELQGDTRIVTRLPADGVYIVELHDLAFEAPGRSPYRLKIGDLRLADTIFPPVLPAGTRREVRPVGTGWGEAVSFTGDATQLLPGMQRPVVIPAGPGVAAPAPAIVAGDAVEVLEQSGGTGPQTVDASQLSPTQPLLAINGTIRQPGEVDEYLLQVRPDSALRLRVESNRLYSALDPQITIRSATDPRRILAQSEEQPQLEFKVPAAESSVRVAIHDLHGTGGLDHLYRLEISAAAQPGFHLELAGDRVLFPQDGRGQIKLQVERRGYAGPIRLAAQGHPGLQFNPPEIPAGASEAWLQWTARSGSHDLLRHVRIVGSGNGVPGDIATIQTGTRIHFAGDASYELAVATLPACGLAVEAASLPRHFYRGIPVEIVAQVQGGKLPTAAHAVRLSLATVERPRARSTNPIRGNFPLISMTELPAIPLQLKTSELPQKSTAAPAGKSNSPTPAIVPPAKAGTPPPASRAQYEATADNGWHVLRSVPIQFQVPVSGPDFSLDSTLQVDVLTSTTGGAFVARTFSPAFRRQVVAAAVAKLGANEVVLVSGRPAKFTGKILRHPDYHEPVEVSLSGLPPEYLAPKVTLPPDQDIFEIVVVSPTVTAGGEFREVKFHVQDSQGHNLQPEVQIPTHIEIRK